MKKLFPLLILSMILGCDSLIDDWSTIQVVNQSKIDLYVTPAYRGFSMYAYPDATRLTGHIPEMILVSKKSKAPIDSGTPWGVVIEEIKSDTLSFYFFSADSIQQYFWEEVRQQYMVLT